jgi:hypothetical protein
VTVNLSDSTIEVSLDRRRVNAPVPEEGEMRETRT